MRHAPQLGYHTNKHRQWHRHPSATAHRRAGSGGKGVWLLLAEGGMHGGMHGGKHSGRYGGKHGGKHGVSLQACPQADTTSRYCKCRGMG